MAFGVIGLAATGDRMQVLVARTGVLLPGEVVLDVLADDALVGRVRIGSWRRTAIRSDPAPADHVHWAKPIVAGLAPGTEYQVVLRDATGAALASATAATLPAAEDPRIRLAVGSCFDIGGRDVAVLGPAYDALRDASEGPVYHLWLGDQVYVDAPWNETTRTRHARRIIFDRYLRSWGLTAPSSLATVMRRSSNWYLPDDHEFWNGYPHPSWLTLFWHTAARVARQVWRAGRRAPPHPAAQGKWGAAAGEAFSVFASGADFERFGCEVVPEQLQRIETNRVVIVLVDTRWHRTIRKSGPGSGFMRSTDLAAVVDLVHDDDRLVCLCLAKPLIGHLPHRGLSRGRVEYGPEDYTIQYTTLWRALTERRHRGWPTLILAGDVHCHGIRSAAEGGLLEVTSSPLSLLDSLSTEAPLGRARRAWVRTRDAVRAGWTRAKAWLRSQEEALRPTVAAASSRRGTVAYPSFAPDGSWIPCAAEVHFRGMPGSSGLATVDIRHPAPPDMGGGPEHLSLTVSHALGRRHPRDGSVRPTIHTCTFRWIEGRWVEEA
jgi:hypothetical protein